MINAEKSTPELLTELQRLRQQVSILLAERQTMEDELRAARDSFQLQMKECVAELERTNHALRESEAHYRTLVENANDIIATISADGVITGVNRSAEFILGWPKDEVIGRDYREFVTPESSALIEERIRHFFLGTKFHTNIEIEVLRKEGGTTLFECRTRPTKDPDGRPTGFQIVYRDITTRKQREEELWQAKQAAEAANREKSEFLSTMSHELRTPLQVMLGYADLLLSAAYGALDEQQQEVIRKINRSALSLLDLITGVLDFNRLEAGRMSVELNEIDMAELIRIVEEETQGLREFSEVKFRVAMEDSLPRITTDGQKLKVVIKNLLGNAFKFTEHGSVTLTARRCPDGVMMSVADTGIGIPAERQALIFEAFRKGEGARVGRSDGVGLGLHIATQFLSLLGGTIAVESEVGKGSTFRIWLPLEKSTANA
jgi:PAS domain S-box-containing protein